MGGLGLHSYDLQFTQGDLIELIRAKAHLGQTGLSTP